MSDELSDISKADLIKALLIERGRRTVVDKDSIVSKLSALHAAYTAEQEPFRSGDLLVWKEGLQNKKMPPYNVPVIVIEQIPTPIFDTEKSSGSAYFREPLNLVAGFIDDDGDFVIFHFDAKRFKKYSEA